MKLLNLTARICYVFSTQSSELMRTVQKVKDDQIRDVVTALDIKLHQVTEQFMIESLPGCRLLSEEGVKDDLNACEIFKGDWLIVDPLDGSNNFLVGMPGYGYMATYLNDGHIKGSAIVLPEHSQNIVMDNHRILSASPIPSKKAINYGTVYYAYPPKQDELSRQVRSALMDLIDSQSAGMYRYGSACVGLYQLLCGKHAAFIGHEIRLWDAIAFLPILSFFGITVKYSIQREMITIVAGVNINFIDRAEQIIMSQQGLVLKKFAHNCLN